MTNSTRDLLTFAAAVTRRPASIGAIAPSSTTLAARLATVVPRTGEPTVVELGPGTGVVSAAIAARLPSGGRALAVEIDSRLVDYLHQTLPSLEVANGDAADLASIVAEHGIRQVDAVISGLPWSLLGSRTQQRILDQAVSSLGPDGVFTTFAYVHALPSRCARRFLGLLRERFDEVLPTRCVWRNAPPALTYVCRRPVR